MYMCVYVSMCMYVYVCMYVCMCVIGFGGPYPGVAAGLGGAPLREGNLRRQDRSHRRTRGQGRSLPYIVHAIPFSICTVHAIQTCHKYIHTFI